MSFVQIIEYETERADEMQRLADARMAQLPPPPPGFRLLVTRDRDRPNHYFTIVEFASYEEAMANSANPETDAFARQMAELCSSPPRFYNLDVEHTAP